MAKIDRIMEHIKEMQLGTKLSVRTLAKDRGVSDATAYKAIKLMEEEGYLETLPRTGTIRVESEKEKKIESITYNEINGKYRKFSSKIQMLNRIIPTIHI